MLASWPPYTVGTTQWLAERGVSRFLKQQYLRSGWLKSLGYGAVAKAHETIDWPGALWALQTQMNLSFHIGGKSAIDLQGRSHYLQFGKSPLQLFMPSTTNLPKWFLKGSWSQPLQITQTNFIEPTQQLNDFSISGITLKISSVERAALELLYLAPKHVSYDEVYLIFENLTFLRPEVVQELLMACQMFRVIRLFLYLAEIQEHPWFHQLKLDKVSIGTGVLQLAKRGVFIKKYQIVIPKELINKEKTYGESLF